MLRAKSLYYGKHLKNFEITTNVIVEVTKCFMPEDAEFVLAERLCQLTIEEYFCNRRQLDRVSNKSDLQMFGCNESIILIQKIVPWPCSLVVSDLHSETKVFRFKSGC